MKFSLSLCLGCVLDHVIVVLWRRSRLKQQTLSLKILIRKICLSYLSLVSFFVFCCIIIVYHHIVTHLWCYVHQSISINPIMCVLLSLEAERKTLKDENRRLSLELERLRKSGWVKWNLTWILIRCVTWASDVFMCVCLVLRRMCLPRPRREWSQTLLVVRFLYRLPARWNDGKNRSTSATPRHHCHSLVRNLKWDKDSVALSKWQWHYAWHPLIRYFTYIYLHTFRVCWVITFDLHPKFP